MGGGGLRIRDFTRSVKESCSINPLSLSGAAEVSLNENHFRNFFFFFIIQVCLKELFQEPSYIAGVNAK